MAHDVWTVEDGPVCGDRAQVQYACSAGLKPSLNRGSEDWAMRGLAGLFRPSKMEMVLNEYPNSNLSLHSPLDNDVFKFSLLKFAPKIVAL
ncbi:hypothetical protein VNO78_25496 [Psophocarpus tetragonolobus]|uniref:DUF7796 domain-containing protein n=1 Tax=Psophocarpus tetragonolobus TaxID=3891 RepID=A0AAN9S6N0_PSOTE